MRYEISHQEWNLTATMLWKQQIAEVSDNKYYWASWEGNLTNGEFEYSTVQFR